MWCGYLQHRFLAGPPWSNYIAANKGVDLEAPKSGNGLRRWMDLINHYHSGGMDPRLDARLQEGPGEPLARCQV